MWKVGNFRISLNFCGHMLLRFGVKDKNNLRHVFSNQFNLGLGKNKSEKLVFAIKLSAPVNFQVNSFFFLICHNFSEIG